jgi:hypothetical protein
MTIPSPFSSDFPLRQTPFRSRIEQQLDVAKNYYAVAFKPGFPLQASELNEIQEIFYVQSTLNKMLPHGGWSGPVPWTGATPADKDQVTMGLSGPVSIGAGWYHFMDTQINGGLGVWVYNNTDLSLNSVHQETGSSSPKYGFKVKPVTVECSSSAIPGTNEDSTLQDQSNFNVIGGPCGAARLKMEITGVGSTAASDEYVIPIFTGPFMRGPEIREIVFENSEIKQVT